VRGVYVDPFLNVFGRLCCPPLLCLAIMCFSCPEVWGEWDDISQSEFHFRVIDSRPNDCECLIKCMKSVALVYPSASFPIYCMSLGTLRSMVA